MLNINKKLSKKGFSLIELMVAVVILVMAIFGIFHAYSVGFMGMADARARTVATNYAREAMEDIKNTDFKEIAYQSSSITVNGIIYNRQVIVQENPNIKRVITTVTWKDRNLNTKMVEADMLVHFIETTAGDPSRIMLIADPYNVLTQNINDPPENIDETKSIITAVVKDAKGNTVTTYSGEITFLIDELNSSGSGTISISPVSANQGIATTTFTASNKGEVIITASANGLADDSVTIKITDPGEAIKINLTNWVGGEEKIFLIPGSVSKITATIVDAGGKTVTDAKNEITISVYSGPGTLSDQQPLTDGVVEITLTSDSTPGTITVTASASGLEAGVIDVITGGKIYLSTSSTTVPVNEKYEIIVTTKDVNGVPINYIGTINLAVESTDGLGGGSLLPNPIIFNGDNSSETIIFTASSVGTVNITAEDQAGILTSADPLSLTVASALVPHYIEVYANPSNIQVGSTDTSTITAKIKNIKNVTIKSYTELIIFTTDVGTFIDGSNSIDTNSPHVTYKNGVATVKFYPPSEINPDTPNATITVTSHDTVNANNIFGSTEINFHLEANHILLNTYPENIKVKGKNPDACAITATILDIYDRIVTDYKGKVKFSIIEGDAKFTLTGSTLITVVNGEAQIILQAGNTPGLVRVKATSSGIATPAYKSIPVINIQLDDSQTTYDTTGLVSFYINIEGVDDLTTDFILNEMQVSWDPSNGETLYKIEIESPYIIGDSAVIVFENSTNPASNGELISVINITLSKTKASNIKLYFSTNMENKNTLDVTFNANSGEYSGEYVVHLK